MTIKFNWLTCVLISGSMLLLLGCGPITSATAIKEARVAIAAADSAGAVEGAPYEYYGALERLKKAREEQGYSDFQAAVDLARQAKRLAIEAKKKTDEGGDPLQRIDPRRAEAEKARRGEK